MHYLSGRTQHSRGCTLYTMSVVGYKTAEVVPHALSVVGHKTAEVVPCTLCQW